MFKIGEFSKLTQVSIRMLRYYDEAGLLKPASTDPWTGYRMYSADQIPTLNKIIYLRDSGFQVSEIAAALAAKNEISLLEQLDRKYREIQETIQSEQDSLDFPHLDLVLSTKNPMIRSELPSNTLDTSMTIPMVTGEIPT